MQPCGREGSKQPWDTVVGFQMVPEDPLALSGNALTSPEMVTKKDDQPVDGVAGVAYFQTLGVWRSTRDSTTSDHQIMAGGNIPRRLGAGFSLMS